MIKVESLYDSSDSVSSSAIASSNACLARWHARSGEFRICAVSLSLSSECTPRSRTRCGDQRQSLAGCTNLTAYGQRSTLDSSDAQFSARPSRIGCVGGSSTVAMDDAFLYASSDSCDEVDRLSPVANSAR